MKKWYLLSLMLATNIIIYAQGFGGVGQGASAIKGKVTGLLIDSVSNAPVEFATVVLLDSKTDKEINGTVTDEKGQFKIADVNLGSYKLVCSFLGYATKTVNDIVLSKKTPDADLANIKLVMDNYVLEGVTVTEEASLYENKIDKLVYNVEKDATVAGGDATDVLRNTPLLSVDLDGNVSLRGSQNIQILINGRPSGMFASSVSEALKSIPANQIKSVEVITTPTAKYDGEGSAGIINIITKKKTAEGFTRSVNTFIGNVQNNAGLNLSASKGRFGVSANGGSFFSWPRPSTTSFIRENTIRGVLQVQEQNGEGENQFIGFNGSLNAFYDINAFNSVTSTFRLNGRQFNRNGMNDIYFDNPLENLTQQYSSTYDAKNLNSGFDWVLDYKIKPDDTERELTFALQLTGNTDDRTNDLIQMDLLGTAPEQELSQLRQNDGKNLETTFQADYVHPFNPNIKLETGLKGVLRRIESDYSTFDRVLNETVSDPFLSNIFEYQQDVYAGYASFNFKLGKKYGLIVGGRYERTIIAGEFDLENPSFENDYDNLLPSIIVSRNFKNFQTLKASYSRRIQRPSLFYINPYSDLTDSRNQTFGNPELEPEISDQIDLSYNTFIKGVGVNGSFYYKRTSDVIEPYLEQITEDGISQTSYRNIGENDSYGFNIFSTATIKRKFTVRGSINVFTYNASATINGEQLSTTAVLWNGFGSAGYDFNGGYKLEAFGFFRSPQQNIQGVTPSFSIFGLGAKKDILKKKGSIGIRVIEPFAKFKSFGTELEGTNFRLESEYKVLFRSFGGTIEYRFGSMNYQQRERRSKIRNSDLKEGGDGQQGGGPQ